MTFVRFFCPYCSRRTYLHIRKRYAHAPLIISRGVCALRGIISCVCECIYCEHSPSRSIVVEMMTIVIISRRTHITSPSHLSHHISTNALCRLDSLVCVCVRVCVPCTAADLPLASALLCCWHCALIAINTLARHDDDDDSRTLVRAVDNGDGDYQTVAAGCAHIITTKTMTNLREC